MLVLFLMLKFWLLEVVYFITEIIFSYISVQDVSIICRFSYL